MGFFGRFYARPRGVRAVFETVQAKTGVGYTCQIRQKHDVTEDRRNRRRHMFETQGE